MWGLAELTPDSISKFAAALKSGALDPLVRKFANYLSTSSSYQEICLTYIIGSAAFFKAIDRDALGVLRKACRCIVRYVTDLLTTLDGPGIEDYCGKVVEVIAKNIAFGRDGPSDFLANLVIRLAEKSWYGVGRLLVGVLSIWREDTKKHQHYRFMLRSLSIVQCCKMVGTADTPLGLIDDVFGGCEFDSCLREQLASEFPLSCCSPLLDYYAEKSPRCRQFLAKRVEARDCLPSRAFGMPDNAWWRHIFGFLDVKEASVLPLVCKFWRESYSEMLRDDERMQKYYLAELDEFGLYGVSQIAPWRYVLRDQEGAFRYFERCIVSGTAGKTELRDELKKSATRYLVDVMKNRATLRIVGHAPACDYFLRLFEMTHRLWHQVRLTFLRPNFLDEGKYEQAIRHFLYEKELPLVLPQTWITQNISKIFSNTPRGKDLLMDLITRHFRNLVGISITLIIHGQTSGIAGELAELIFSRTDLFRRLVAESIEPKGYYNFIADSGFFAELVAECHGAPELYQLLISIVLHFREQSDMIDKIMASILDRLPDGGDPAKVRIREQFQAAFLGSLSAATRYPPEDVGFVEGVVKKYGWVKFKI